MTSRFLLLALFTGGQASAAGLPRTFTINSFDRVRVEGPYSVALCVGRAPGARAEGSPAQLDAIDLRVEGRTLIIRQRSGSQSTSNVGPVHISVATPDLRSATLIGAGSLSIDRLKGLSIDLGLQGPGSLKVGDVQADRVIAFAQGSGSLTLGGRSKAVAITSRGTASVDTSALKSSEVTISGEGAGEVRANASERASINAAGALQMFVTGGPTCVLRLAGSATVEGCERKN